MALLERVATLIRANINDLIDKAEDPEKMIKQLILDMENQLLQVKTQVAVAIADQHMLEKKRAENQEKADEWMHRAEVAVDRNQDDLARRALERHRSYKQLAESFAEQVADQKVQVENLKTAFGKLEAKLTEARSKSDLLLTRHRRARAIGKASEAHMNTVDQSKMAAFDRMKRKVIHAEATSQAKAELAAESVEDQLEALEREDEIDKLLLEVKARRGVKA
jgi:phage shock protein A